MCGLIIFINVGGQAVPIGSTCLRKVLDHWCIAGERGIFQIK